MKKSTLSSIAAATLVLTTVTTAFAASSSSGVVMFGDSAGRQHVNSISDPFPWTQEAFLGQMTVPSSKVTLLSSDLYSGMASSTLTTLTSSLQARSSVSVPMAGNSSAIGAGNILAYPVSAPNDDPNGLGYLTFWNMASWVAGPNGEQPQLLKVVPIKGVSNSSPVYDPATGDIYLAAGGTFYKFTKSFYQGNNAQAYQTTDISTANPIQANQVVSYPLFATASQLGAPVNSMWISSQNGNLYVVNPSTMKLIATIGIKVRLDASPSLVTTTDGKPVIAVTGAYNPNNASYYVQGTGVRSGTGMLFLINPQNFRQSRAADPYGSIPSVASPISLHGATLNGVKINNGYMLWNDVEGDVMMGSISPSGAFHKVRNWPNIGSGQTSYSSESAFSPTADEFIEPFTNNHGGIGIVDLQTGRYFDDSFNGEITPDGTPEISADGNLYVSDYASGLDHLFPNNTDGNKYSYGSGQAGSIIYTYPGVSGVATRSGAYESIPSSKSAGSSQLTTPEELNLDTVLGSSNGPLATLASATTNGLQLWINTGEYLDFGTPYPGTRYTSGSPTLFTQPLYLRKIAGNLPTASSPLLTRLAHMISLPTGQTYSAVLPRVPDKIYFNLSLGNQSSWNTYSNGDPKYLASEDTYNMAGNPSSSIELSTSQLNTMLATYLADKHLTWNKHDPHTVYVQAVVPTSGNLFSYDLAGSNAVTPASAIVAVNFNPAVTVSPPPKAKSGFSGLTVPQWMLSQYFPNIINTTADSGTSVFSLSVPAQTWQNPHLNPSGAITFSLVNPDRSLFPAWLYSSQAKLWYDSLTKDVNVPNPLSQSFREEGTLLAVKADRSTFDDQLAAWPSGNTSPFSVIGSTDKGSLNSASGITKSTPIQYNITSGRIFYYSETRYRLKYHADGTSYLQPYTYTGRATETDYPARYDLQVHFDHYTPSASLAPNTFYSQSHTGTNGFAWFSSQHAGTFNVDPEVPAFYQSSGGADHLVYLAGERLRPIKPVSYSTEQFTGVTLKPHTDGTSVATSQAALALQARLGDGTSSGVLYKGSSVTNSVQASGNLVLTTYALDINNPTLKNLWGDSGYSPQSVNSTFLSNAGANYSNGQWSINMALEGRMKIGANFYGQQSSTKTITGTTSETTYNIVVRGGKLVSVNGSSNFANLPASLQAALTRMYLNTDSNVFNTFERGAGSWLSSSSLASLANGVTGTSDYSTSRGWYNEGSTSMAIDVFTTTFPVPSMTWSSQIPMDIPGLQEPVDKTMLFSVGDQAFLYYNIGLKNGGYMTYDSSQSSPFGNRDVVAVIPNATVYDSFNG